MTSKRLRRRTRPCAKSRMEKHMETIDIKIDFPAPPREIEQAIEHKFVEKSTRAGAINAYICIGVGSRICTCFRELHLSTVSRSETSPLPHRLQYCQTSRSATSLSISSNSDSKC